MTPGHNHGFLCFVDTPADLSWFSPNFRIIKVFLSLSNSLFTIWLIEYSLSLFTFISPTDVIINKEYKNLWMMINVLVVENFSFSLTSSHNNGGLEEKKRWGIWLNPFCFRFHLCSWRYIWYERIWNTAKKLQQLHYFCNLTSAIDVSMEMQRKFSLTFNRECNFSWVEQSTEFIERRC